MSSHVVKIAPLLLILFLVACSKSETPKPMEPSAGELVFNKNCKVCHAQGLNGAPILGNKAMWKDRISKGESTLVEHAVQGFGLMPAKGGNTDLSDADVAKAVGFMVSKVQ